MVRQKIAILAGGPSLPRFWNEEKFKEYETVIGINSATFLYDTHWAVVIDPEMVNGHLKQKEVHGRFGITPKIGFLSGPQWKPQLLMQGKQYRDFPGAGLGCYWSFVNALFFANSLERLQDFQIDVYGFDCAIDQSDCNGLVVSHDRGRFKRELQWVKNAWRSGNRVFSDLNPEILEWLQDKKEDLPL